MNTALVFIKPHAVNDAVVSLSREHLAAAGVEVVKDGRLTGAEILKGSIIDDHYAALAANAVKLAPKDLNVPEENRAKFQAEFGKAYDAAAADGTVINLASWQAENPGMSAAEIERRWRAGKTVKLAPGTYVSEIEGGAGKLVVNGFYASMREKFISGGALVHWFLVRFPEASLSWAAFREATIGATNPEEAAPGSLRRRVLDEWAALGLPCQPSTADNGVHASAGPVEGLRERAIWLGTALDADPFGAELLAAGVSRATVERLCANEVVSLLGATGPAYDLTEGVDSARAAAAILEWQQAGGQ
jgi:nucleoside diphosphate kinase